MGAFSVLAIVCLSVGIASACDFETLVTECTPPTATEESAFCGQYATYKECATDASSWSQITLATPIYCYKKNRLCSTTYSRH